MTQREANGRRLARVVPVAALLLAASVAGAADRGADGDFARRDSFHFTLYQDVDIDETGGFNGSRRFELRLLDTLEAAFDRLDQILSLRPRKKLVVYVWDPELFDREYAGLFKFPAAGFYGGVIHVRGGTQLTPRLVSVLHHELVHAAFDAESPNYRIPAWLNEGIADWFAARALGKRGLDAREAGALQQLVARGGLFALAELGGPSFAGLGPEAARIAYLQSYAFVDHLARSRGEQDLVRFWSAVVRSRNLDRAARRAFRSDLGKLEAEFRSAYGAR